MVDEIVGYKVLNTIGSELMSPLHHNVHGHWRKNDKGEHCLNAHCHHAGSKIFLYRLNDRTIYAFEPNLDVYHGGETFEHIEGEFICYHNACPEEFCECGIHLSRDIHRSVQFGMNLIASYPNHTVIAKVAGYGKVIEHEKGWRVEKAKVIRYWDAADAFECFSEIRRA